MSQFTINEVLELLSKFDIPAAPVWNVDTVVKLDYAKQRRMIVSIWKIQPGGRSQWRATP